MEPAKIDWNRIESIFVEDKLYENINAPKWVDFLSPDDLDSIDDDSWFCKPDCKHPKTAEDFLRRTPTSKISSFADKTKTLLSDWSQRDARLKKRGQSRCTSTSRDRKAKFEEDVENWNPNLSTPPTHQQAKSMKSMIKSSSEKPKAVDDAFAPRANTPSLKSTLSARNLFAGKDILGHISEFCNELKKMAMRAKEQEENNGKLNDTETPIAVNESSGVVLGEGVKKDRKPFCEIGSERIEEPENGSIKEKQKRKIRVDNAENIPISIDMANVKRKGDDRVLQIRTNPPSPQCFSATKTTTPTPLKTSNKSRLMERGILQEVKQQHPKETPNKDENANKGLVDGGGALNMFWFLKPCTLSS